MPDSSVNGSAAISPRPAPPQLRRPPTRDRDPHRCRLLVLQWVHRVGLASFQEFRQTLTDSEPCADLAWLDGLLDAASPAMAMPRSRQTGAAESPEHTFSPQPEQGQASLVAAAPALEPHGPADPADVALRATAAVDAALIELDRTLSNVFHLPPPVRARPEPLPIPEVLPNFPTPPVFQLGSGEGQTAALNDDPAFSDEHPPETDDRAWNPMGSDFSGPFEPGHPDSMGMAADSLPTSTGEGFGELAAIQAVAFEAVAPDPDQLAREADPFLEALGRRTRIRGLLKRSGLMPWLRSSLAITQADQTSDAPHDTTAPGEPMAAASAETAAMAGHPGSEPSMEQQPPDPAQGLRLLRLQGLHDRRTGPNPAPAPAAIADLRAWLPDRHLPEAS